MPNQICIPNVACVNTNVIIIILAVVIVYVLRMKQNIKKVYINTASKIIEKRPQDERPGLYRQMYDKLEEPSKVAVNIRTRGPEVSYQQVGYVYRDETDPAYNPDESNRMPLYGRPDYAGADKWEYYVIPKGETVKIELSNNKEIFDADTVSVQGFAGSWIARIYENKMLKYIPFI